VVNEWFNRQRTDNGVEIVPPSAALRRCLERLKDNQLIALVGDRDFSRSGVPIDFFGQKTAFPKGPVAFAARTGAAIIPTFFVREGYGKFRLFVETPLYPDELGIREDDEQGWLDVIQRYARQIEAKVRRYPTQWMMFREFWLQ